MKEVPPKHDLTEPRAWFSVFRGHGGWIPIVAAVICIAVTFGSVVGYQSAARYERVGVETQAEAVSRRIRRDSEGSDDYYVTYRFTVDQQTVQRERKVSRAQHRSAPAGSSHTIRYLPDNPRKFETYVGQAHDGAVIMQWIAGFAGVGSLIALWRVGGRANRSVLTRRFGYRAVAKIERIVETRNSGRPSGKGYLIWRTPDDTRGESMMHPIHKLNAIGTGAEINIYVRKGHSVWEGDVGPQETDDSRIPKVRR
ncbi:DUF3592 domain-containing protein [Yoonia sp. F2084L]|uniref:DUF3592 domain-containing protein n=1 Tax=Yoonia sp. F2084L TaxID=2926419 RepID=UPI001FF3AF65|nr:DUF3592 domain-containing protein [Yoonia sp. F2084L]MCK0095415.1 DUF3592 domain-containing protein [Yoonia sp. F2084L]